MTEDTLAKIKRIGELGGPIRLLSLSYHADYYEVEIKGKSVEAVLPGDEGNVILALLEDMRRRGWNPRLSFYGEYEADKWEGSIRRAGEIGCAFIRAEPLDAVASAWLAAKGE